jgi:hypothetical protein
MPLAIEKPAWRARRRAAVGRRDDGAVKQEREDEQLRPGDDSGQTGHGQVVLNRVGALESQVIRDVRDHQRNGQRDPEHDESKCGQDRARVGEDTQPPLPVPAGVVEEHLCHTSEEERLPAHGQHGDAQELRVERELDRA